MNKTDLQLKLNSLVEKWKDREKPLMYSNEWWRYRADQIQYKYYRNELKKINSAQKQNEIFD